MSFEQPKIIYGNQMNSQFKEEIKAEMLSLWESTYGDEIKKTVEEKEQQDETNPDDYEDKASNIDYIEETPDLKEVTTDEEEFRQWEGIEEDWQEFNRKNNPEINKKQGGG